MSNIKHKLSCNSQDDDANMKKKIFMLGTLVVIIGTIMTGCQGAARSLGGSITLRLDPGVKLEEITWKDDSLWYLTRPMSEDEVPETHTFQ